MLGASEKLIMFRQIFRFVFVGLLTKLKKRKKKMGNDGASLLLMTPCLPIFNICLRDPCISYSFARTAIFLHHEHRSTHHRPCRRARAPAPTYPSPYNPGPHRRCDRRICRHYFFSLLRFCWHSVRTILPMLAYCYPAITR